MKYIIIRIDIPKGEFWFTPDLPFFNDRDKAEDFISDHMEMLDCYAVLDVASAKHVYLDRSDKSTRIDILEIPDNHIGLYFHATEFVVAWTSDHDGSFNVSKIVSYFYNQDNYEDHMEEFMTQVAEMLQGEVHAITLTENFSNLLDVKPAILESASI